MPPYDDRRFVPAPVLTARIRNVTAVKREDGSLLAVAIMKMRL